MAYLGNTPELQNFAAGADRFSGDSSTTIFTLTRRVTSANDVIAYVENVPQDPFSAYTVTANTVSGTADVTFTSAPPTNTNNIVINYRATQIVSYNRVTSSVIEAGAITTVKIADANVTNDKIVSVANTKITGLVTASQIANVANTQITGLVTASQIANVANTQITGLVTASQIANVANTQVTGIITIAQGGTGSTTLAGANIPVTSAASTFTNKQTFTGSTSSISTSFVNAVETANISAIAATGTINLDFTTASVHYYTSNASNNFTVNIRGNSTTNANTLMTTGDAITVVFLVTNGATAYYNNALTIDGNSVTPKYQNGSAPTAGNANSVDIYSYAVVKTGSGTFTVFASQVRFA